MSEDMQELKQSINRLFEKVDSIDKRTIRLETHLTGLDGQNGFLSRHMELEQDFRRWKLKTVAIATALGAGAGGSAGAIIEKVLGN